MNPIHIGHYQMIQDSINRAKEQGAELKVFLTQTQDNKLNPIPYKDKVNFLSLLFHSKYIGETTTSNIFDLMTELSKEYSEIELIVGGDRFKQFKKSFKQYSYLFSCPISVSNFSNRDKYPISSTSMRKFALDGDWKRFIDNCPPLSPNRKFELYRLTSIGLMRTVKTKHGTNRGLRSDPEG